MSSGFLGDKILALCERTGCIQHSEFGRAKREALIIFPKCLCLVIRLKQNGDVDWQCGNYEREE